jgi:tRNA (guanine37-N1)-methyltransferase
MRSLNEALKNKLSQQELLLLPKSYDVIGSIAVFSDMPHELVKKEKLIGEAMLKLHKNLKTITKKTEKHAGTFRTKKVKILAGRRTKTTEYKESKVTVRLNVETCYFSPRLSNERLRIAKLVNDNESVLVMFSGVGIYPLVIAKNSRPKEVYAIEINPSAHRFAVENVKLNKVGNIFLYNGDVRKVMPKLNKKFDRIVMPLPMSAESFLDTAIQAAEKGTIIHFYDFVNEGRFNEAVDKIKRHVRGFKILDKVECGQYAPRRYRVCIDFAVK